MEQELIDYFTKNLLLYIPLGCQTALEKVHNLFFNDKLFNPNSPVEYHYMGHYFRLKKNYFLMKLNYKIAIEEGFSISFNSMGNYYQNLKINYNKMKYYYNLSIKEGHSYPLIGLGNYYYNTRKFIKAKKYYKLAIKKGNIHAIYNLGLYYEDIEKNYIKMEKYYLMAIEKNIDAAMNNLGYYYQTIRDYDTMKKYYLMAIEKKNKFAINKLITYYEFNNMKLDLIELYITYPFITNQCVIINHIIDIIKNESYKENPKKFTQLLNKILNDTLTMNSILLINLTNSQKIDF